MIKNFPALPVEDEGRLGDLKFRESFVRRVYMMHFWQQMIAEGLSEKSLTEFHGHHKYMFINENKNESRALDLLVAQCDKNLVKT
ncbi:MAG: hypothetical protein V7721_08465 [Porticoccaceae bacterium]